MKKSYKGFPIYALIIIGVLIATQLFSSSFSSQRGKKIEVSELYQYIESGSVDAVALENNTAYVHAKTSSIPLASFSAASYDYSAVISRDTFVFTGRLLAARRFDKSVDEITELDLGFDLIYLPQPTTPWLLEMLPYLVMTVGLMFFWALMMRQQGGGGGKMMTFGHSPARVFEPDGNRVTFADVAGAVEEKEEMQELVEFLKNPRRFTAVGARIPKGVLLVGPPGTGKTLLAKAVAGEAGVPFMSISGSDFVEMFVGVGASRVRRSTRRASSLSTKSTRWAAAAARVWAADTMSASRRSTSCSLRWMALRSTRASLFWRRRTARIFWIPRFCARVVLIAKSRLVIRIFADVRRFCVFTPRKSRLPMTSI